MDTQKPENSPVTRCSLLLRVRDTENQRAWGEFVEIYTPLIHRHCLGRGLQAADAADVSQEVMRAVSRAIRHFDYDPERGSFRGWLRTVVRSKLNNFWAKKWRQPELIGGSSIQQLVEDHPSPEDDETWDREYAEAVFAWASVQVRKEVNETTWRAFERTAVEGEAGEKVAQSLGMTAGAVYVARSRVLARLKAKVEEVSDESFLFGGESRESSSPS